ncbi:tetratricopeptide repeat protein [Cognatishimia sp.]|uniref:tetratricopeptide repeat protein n=1 Tax=Cognatishimia sp. TaxID=2211648 RepID=UPI00351642E5
MTVMVRLPHIVKLAVAAGVLLPLSGVAFAQDRLDDLMQDLRGADAVQAQRISGEIELLWRQSGSASADLLLKRGLDALERGELDAAVDHLSALTDHAPEFAEGWVSRAGAFVRMGYYGMAISDLEHALALNPQHYEAIYGLGVVLETIGRPADAFEAMQLLQTIHPHYPDLSETLARLEPLALGQTL